MFFKLKWPIFYFRKISYCLFLSLAISTFLFSADAYGQYICEKGDCENGFGKKTVSNSDAFMEGKFVDGVLKEGKVFFPNGDIFEGKFENNFLVEGQKKLKNGKKLEGKFFENVLINGKITDLDGTSRFIKLKRIN